MENYNLNVSAACVRIVGFTDSYREMLAASLSPYFAAVDGTADLLVCEAGCEPRGYDKNKTIIIGNTAKQLKGAHFLSRPLDIAAFVKTALSLISVPGESAVGSYIVNPAGETVMLGGKTAQLTSLEFRLFMLLYSRIGEPVSRDVIREELWPESENTNICDVYICYLRRKLEPLAGAGALVSVRGRGYVLVKQK